MSVRGDTHIIVLSPPSSPSSGLHRAWKWAWHLDSGTVPALKLLGQDLDQLGVLFHCLAVLPLPGCFCHFRTGEREGGGETQRKGSGVAVGAEVYVCLP